MNKDQLKHFKHLLQQHREEHANIVNDMIDGTLGDYRNTEDTELSRYDNHPADAATDLYDAEQQAALRSNHEFIMREIDDALERIKKDTYGRCELCGKQIDPKRLEIIPDTRNCINCEISEEHEIRLDKISKHAHRPVEEDVLEKVMRGHHEAAGMNPMTANRRWRRYCLCRRIPRRTERLLKQAGCCRQCNQSMIQRY